MVLSKTSFTDQKLRIVTEEDLKAPWSGYRDGSHFRCYLCGWKFELGDQWRFVYSASRTFVSPFDNKTFGLSNVFVCGECDDTNEKVLDKWVAAHEELYTKFWWAVVPQKKGEQNVCRQLGNLSEM